MPEEATREEIQEEFNCVVKGIDMKKFWQDHAESVKDDLEKIREARARSMQDAMTRVVY